MTDSEKQEILNLVVASLRTNSKTIDQLTPVITLGDDDKFEIDGGRYVDVATVKALICQLASADHGTIIQQINDNKILSANIAVSDNVITLEIQTAAGVKKSSVTIPDIHPVVEVESEEAMEALIAGGEIDDKTMYFVPEE